MTKPLRAASLNALLLRPLANIAPETLTGTGITVPGPTRSRGVGDFVNELAAQQGQTLAASPSNFLNRTGVPYRICS